MHSKVSNEDVSKFRNPEEEYNENLHKVSLILRGECGLLFTNEKTEDVLEYFENLSEPDFAR
jgi:mRNA turnover protein 4